MGRPPPSDAYTALDVFGTAVRFHEACNFIQERSDHKKEPHLLNTLGYPMLALSALCNELLLKTLHSLEGKHVPKSHNLAALFRDLDRKTRHAIEKRWEGLVAARMPVWKIIVDGRHGPKHRLPESLDDALQMASQAFEAFRYSFERKDELPDYFIDDLRLVLLREILARQPAWRNLSLGSLAQEIAEAPPPHQAPPKKEPD